MKDFIENLIKSNKRIERLDLSISIFSELLVDIEEVNYEATSVWIEGVLWIEGVPCHLDTMPNRPLITIYLSKP